MPVTGVENVRGRSLPDGRGSVTNDISQYRAVTVSERSFNRRTLFFAMVPLRLGAQDSGDRTAITEMFGAVAASLSADNPAAAMKWFDPAMPRIEPLRAAFHALVEKFEVASAISILSLENRTVVLDWFLELKSRGSSAPVERRRSNVKCQVGRKGKAWRIVNLEPVEYFE